jgi:signal transduction histidine kinase
MIPAAALISNIALRGLGEPFWSVITKSLIVGCGYAAAALALLSPRLMFNPRLVTVRDLMLLVAAAIVSSAVVTTLYVGTLTVMGVISLHDAFHAALLYWVGDMIGIAVVTPFGLLTLTRGAPLQLKGTTIIQLAVIAITLFFAAKFSEYGRLKYFFVMSFPVIWIALTDGIEGTSAALVLIQFGLLIAVRLFHLDYLDITDFQARMFVLSVTGLVAGALVSERRRAEEELRQQQEALAQVATRGSMGELGAAIAHEVNQPLSAASTYAGLVAESLTSEDLRDPSSLDNARKAVKQIERASQVVRRVRALVRLAHSDAAPVAVERIVHEVVDLMQADADRLGIALRTDIARDLSEISADRLQIEQALINLIRNAMDAMTSAKSSSPAVTVYAQQRSDGTIELGVKDNGPGFARDFSLEALQPFSSTKAEGLGIGLSLCRSIAIAHGGHLHVHKAERGAHVSINLPPSSGRPHVR